MFWSQIRTTYLPHKNGVLRMIAEHPVFLASLITPSWNQVVGFLTDWEVLRRLAA
jgi:hypothetical protein